MMIQNDDTNDDTNDMIEEWLLQNTDFDIEMCESICSVNLNKYILSETQTQNITLSQQEETEYNILLNNDIANDIILSLRDAVRVEKALITLKLHDNHDLIIPILHECILPSLHTQNLDLGMTLEQATKIILTEFYHQTTGPSWEQNQN